MMSIQQHFRALGLNQNATFREAKLAYKRLVRMWHPDRFSDDSILKESAEEIIREINVAYEAIESFFSTTPTASTPAASKIQKWLIVFCFHLNGLREMSSAIAAAFRPCGANRFWNKTLKTIAAMSSVTSHRHSRQAGFEDIDRGGGRNFEQVMQEVIREKIPTSALRQ